MEINFMNGNDIIHSINHLKNSPLFAISLCGKELSHSNFWAWLINQRNSQDRNPYIEVFIPGFYDNGFKFISVHREKNNMDLSIKYKDKTNKELIYVIENKIKSLPESIQLNKYKNFLENKRKFGGGLLTGLCESLDLNYMEGWNFLGYDKIASRILKIRNNNTQMNYSDIIKQYADDVKHLSNIIKNKISQSKNKYFYEDPELDEIRFSDIFVKFKGSEFIKKINEKLFELNEIFININNWTRPIAEFSFNHKKPTITVVYKELESPIDSKTEYGRLGVQIEGRAFRIYGGGSKFGIHSEENVSKKMFSINYLQENFQSDRFRTSMKNKYCKYSGAEYCHLYQYWNIENCNYNFLITKIVEQLLIAKEIIESGFTFKK